MSASRGAVRRPLPRRSTVMMALMAASPCAGISRTLVSAGEPVPQEGHPLRAVGAVGQPPSEDADQRAHSLVQPVHEAERQRGQAQDSGEVEREHRGDGLRRDVGQHADEPQEDDRASHAARRCAAGSGSGA